MLVGKNIIITGASSGIGEQLAYQYAQYGANVFITARREHRLQQVSSTRFELYIMFCHNEYCKTNNSNAYLVLLI